jgi:hypothetical protein
MSNIGQILDKCWKLSIILVLKLLGGPFKHVSHHLMSNIGQILDKCWKLSIISATRSPRRLVLVSKLLSNYILGKIFLISDMSVISSCPILDKYWTNFKIKHYLSNQTRGWLSCQNDRLTIYWGRNFNFRYTHPILDKYWINVEN